MPLIDSGAGTAMLSSPADAAGNDCRLRTARTRAKGSCWIGDKVPVSRCVLLPWQGEKLGKACDTVVHSIAHLKLQIESGRALAIRVRKLVLYSTACVD